MNLQDVWQAVKQAEEVRNELNRQLQQVPGILGCWQPHHTATTFSLWGYWEGKYYEEMFQLSAHSGLEVWYKVDESGKTDKLVSLSGKDARLLVKIWENFV